MGVAGLGADPDILRALGGAEAGNPVVQRRSGRQHDDRGFRGVIGEPAKHAQPVAVRQLQVQERQGEFLVLERGQDDLFRLVNQVAGVAIDGRLLVGWDPVAVIRHGQPRRPVGATLGLVLRAGQPREAVMAAWGIGEDGRKVLLGNLKLMQAEKVYLNGLEDEAKRLQAGWDEAYLLKVLSV